METSKLCVLKKTITFYENQHFFTNYDFNTDDTLNTLLLNCMFASGRLKEGEMYDVDFDLYG